MFLLVSFWKQLISPLLHIIRLIIHQEPKKRSCGDIIIDQNKTKLKVLNFKRKVMISSLGHHFKHPSIEHKHVWGWHNLNNLCFFYPFPYFVKKTNFNLFLKWAHSTQQDVRDDTNIPCIKLWTWFSFQHLWNNVVCTLPITSWNLLPIRNKTNIPCIKLWT